MVEACLQFTQLKNAQRGGSCLSLFTRFTKGPKFYGSNTAFVTLNEGHIYGANINILGFSNGGKVDGLECAVLANILANITEPPATPSKITEPPATPSKINGIQVSFVINEADRKSKCLQIGICNRTRYRDPDSNKENTAKQGLLFNYSLGN